MSSKGEPTKGKVGSAALTEISKTFDLIYLNLNIIIIFIYFTIYFNPFFIPSPTPPPPTLPPNYNSGSAPSELMGQVDSI